MERDLMPGVKIAGPSTTLWRYMSLSKLLQMLQARTIWFSRVDQLIKDDPYEGSLPFYPLDKDESRSALKEAETERRANLSAGSISNSRDRFFQKFKIEREHTFVSCWHSGATDNAAMWRLYGAEKDGSVCVKTTVSLLGSQLPGYVKIGRIEYVSYETSWPEHQNAYLPFFRKRTCFEHEKEVRLLFNRVHDQLDAPPDNQTLGHPVPFDPQKSLSAIYISPTAPGWFGDVVREALVKLNYAIPVEDAPMAKRPAF